MMNELLLDEPLSTDSASPSGAGQSDPARGREGRAARALPDDALIIVPVRNVVLFPGIVVPITVGRERSRAAAQEAARTQRPLGVLLQSKPEVDEPGADDEWLTGGDEKFAHYPPHVRTHRNCRIDWILIRGPLACRDATIDYRIASDGLMPSDHYPVTASIDWLA